MFFASERLLQKKKAQQVEGGTPSETLSTRELTNTEATSTVITTNSIAKAKKATPYDKDFREQILSPRGILIEKPHSISVWDHFETEAPKEDRQAYYRKKGSEHSSVWLNADKAFADEVAQEYECMIEGEMCEAEFASYAREVSMFGLPLALSWPMMYTLKISAYYRQV